MALDSEAVDRRADRRARVAAALKRAKKKPDLVSKIRSVQKKAVPRGNRLGRMRAKVFSGGMY